MSVWSKGSFPETGFLNLIDTISSVGETETLTPFVLRTFDLGVLNFFGSGLAMEAINSLSFNVGSLSFSNARN